TPLLDHLVSRAPKTPGKTPVKTPGKTSGKATPILPLSEKTLATWIKTQPPAQLAWIKAGGFKAKPGSFVLLPDNAGQ
ncbi:MAG: hypothetical protein J0626_04755, partial [Rhodospirillaceae bacterium]|nr:hypothetical protein [Rhodospirillaceae bacterium]